MQIPVIKELVEQYDVAQLTDAEEALLEELPLPIKVEGKDDGEVLTHILAAIWIIERMESNDLPFAKALREYTSKVRVSISG
ncbi:hypothetical protein BFP72_07795 [Reichenbachiella sp. 5M10]|uniref:DUF6952 family protein n=1 Tax=Reichenbachiella sp. 5M10 TaxID=1889772 RepID=UPI000C14623F|nr:hypothetical protein [Reichenbachiella sp. 5M10]PIB35307.1 hypothetical protein BFP72_07795 [Reichenbachiella sp. 5M10]